MIYWLARRRAKSSLINRIRASLERENCSYCHFYSNIRLILETIIPTTTTTVEISSGWPMTLANIINKVVVFVKSKLLWYFKMFRIKKNKKIKFLNHRKIFHN